MKVALAQMNSVLGDFSRNSAEILRRCQQAHAAGADLVVFPEMTLYGYPPMDLLERTRTVDDQLNIFQKLIKKVPPGLLVLMGLVTENNGPGKPFLNSVAAVHKDKKPRFFHKSLLPAYDVFDEGRHFHVGDGDEANLLLNLQEMK